MTIEHLIWITYIEGIILGISLAYIAYTITKLFKFALAEDKKQSK
jgi:hypothetical protein